MPLKDFEKNSVALQKIRSFRYFDVGKKQSQNQVFSDGHSGTVVGTYGQQPLSRGKTTQGVNAPNNSLIEDQPPRVPEYEGVGQQSGGGFITQTFTEEHKNSNITITGKKGQKNLLEGTSLIIDAYKDSADDIFQSIPINDRTKGHRQLPFVTSEGASGLPGVGFSTQFGGEPERYGEESPSIGFTVQMGRGGRNKVLIGARYANYVQSNIDMYGRFTAKQIGLQTMTPFPGPDGENASFNVLTFPLAFTPGIRTYRFGGILNSGKPVSYLDSLNLKDKENPFALPGNVGTKVRAMFPEQNENAFDYNAQRFEGSKIGFMYRAWTINSNRHNDYGREWAVTDAYTGIQLLSRKLADISDPRFSTDLGGVPLKIENSTMGAKDGKPIITGVYDLGLSLKNAPAGSKVPNAMVAGIDHIYAPYIKRILFPNAYLKHLELSTNPHIKTYLNHNMLANYSPRINFGKSRSYLFHSSLLDRIQYRPPESVDGAFSYRGETDLDGETIRTLPNSEANFGKDRKMPGAHAHSPYNLEKRLFDEDTGINSDAASNPLKYFSTMPYKTMQLNSDPVTNQVQDIEPPKSDKIPAQDIAGKALTEDPGRVTYEDRLLSGGEMNLIIPTKQGGKGNDTGDGISRYELEQFGSVPGGDSNPDGPFSVKGHPSIDREALGLAESGLLVDNIKEDTNIQTDRSKGRDMVYNIGKQGHVTSTTSRELVWNNTLGKMHGTRQGDKLFLHKVKEVDKVNIIPYGNPTGSNDNLDFVPLKFHDVYNNKDIIFRSILGSITDAVTPEWNEQKFIGRTQKTSTYTGVDRKISFDFKIYPKTKQEIPVLIEKTNFLVGLCYPNLDANFRQTGPLIKLTLGDIVKKQLGFLTQCTVTFPEESTWDLTPGMRFTKLIQVQIEFQYIGNYIPVAKGKHYDAKWLAHGTSTGTSGIDFKDFPNRSGEPEIKKIFDGMGQE